MTSTEDIVWVGKLLDAYAVNERRIGVASRNPTDAGVPAEMQSGPIDGSGWVEWRVLSSTLTETDVAQLETRFGIQLPPLFRAFLLARFHLFDQVRSTEHDELILMPDLPSGKPLTPLVQILSAWQPLIEAGYIPFAEFGDGYGPMCFDTHRRRADDDCPIIWFDHEVLVPLGDKHWRTREKVLPLAQPLYDSFRDLLLDVFGNAAPPNTGSKTETVRAKLTPGELVSRIIRLNGELNNDRTKLTAAVVEMGIDPEHAEEILAMIDSASFRTSMQIGSSQHTTDFENDPIFKAALKQFGYRRPIAERCLWWVAIGILLIIAAVVIYFSIDVIRTMIGH